MYYEIILLLVDVKFFNNNIYQEKENNIVIKIKF